jgi:P4 family phage/plasmid primase-like protien
LFNINKDSLYIWKKFSKQSKKYNEDECDKKWKTFKTNKDGLKIGSLIYWLKHDNLEKYKDLRRKIISQSVLNQRKNKYTNTMEIDKIYQNIDCNYVELKDTFCDILQTHHEGNDTHLEMHPTKFNMKCHNPRCRGKSICDHVVIPRDDVKVVFNQFIQNNYYVNTPGDDENGIDDFKKINIFDTEYMNNLVYKGLNGKPIPFARMMYELTKDIYEYAENDQWYMYEKHKWNLLKGYNADLREAINTQLKDIYTQVNNYYIEQEGKNSKTVKSVTHLITSLDGTQLTDDIMKELKYIFVKNNKDKNFLEKLDSNQNLIGFENEVYDLSLYIFRDGKKEDYISMSTKYNYTNKYSKHHNKLIQFLEDIQPNKSERDYLLIYISTALFGNTLELFTVLVGDGRNGKSKFVQLLEKVFGDYYDTIKSQLLTSQMKEGDAPSPALLSLANKRIVVASETLEGTKLNTGFIKFITGRDTVKHRMCHKNDMIKFSPNFVSLLICNNIPECDNMDIAFSKRLRCINFPTEFVNGKIIKANQKHKDPKINTYFDDWKQDFFLLLLEYYKNYEKNEDLMNPTENVSKWTSQYKEDTDIYQQFINECTEESDSHIRSVDLYEHFKNWFTVNNPKTKIPSNRCYFSNIKRFGKKIEIVKIEGKAVSGIKKIQIKLEHKIVINRTDYNLRRKLEKDLKKCIGVNNICPYNNIGASAFDNYCKPCFANLFPADIRTKNIRHGSKEITVINYVCNNHEGIWYHNITLNVNYEGGCCTTRRRIDLYIFIEGTLICLEVDEDQHRYYPRYDEFIRYNEFMCDMTCKYIFIRYNPDKYKLNGKIMDMDLKLRLNRLSIEINKQIERIKNLENTDLFEVVHLFYDEDYKFGYDYDAYIKHQNEKTT